MTPKPDRYRPSGTSAGPVNHSSPVPAVWIPNSVPLRAIATTIVEPGRSLAESEAALAMPIARLSMKWSFAVDEPEHGGQVGRRELDFDQIGDDLADEQ